MYHHNSVPLYLPVTGSYEFYSRISVIASAGQTASFLRAALFQGPRFNPLLYCHRPIIVRDEHATLGEVIPKLKVHPERSDDDVIDDDIILFWGQEKRIITGSDILGRLLRGIVQQQEMGFRRLVLAKGIDSA